MFIVKLLELVSIGITRKRHNFNDYIDPRFQFVAKKETTFGEIANKQNFFKFSAVNGSGNCRQDLIILLLV